MNIGVMYTFLGDVKNNETDRDAAKHAFNEAFKIYDPEKYPNDFQELTLVHGFYLNTI